MIITFLDVIINKILKYFGAPAKPDKTRLKIFWVYFFILILIGSTIGLLLLTILKNPAIKIIVGSCFLALGYSLSKSKLSPEKTLLLTRWWLGEGRWSDGFKILF
jgi:uncharacterized membrane protein YfcA